MNKPILVVTHERSGTHLLINLINYTKNGEFNTIGFIPQNIPYTLENYKHQVYKDITIYSYSKNIICKSHHQIDFMKPYLDFIFSKYNVIFLKRNIKDVLVSYYKFIPYPKDLEIFPSFKNWIYTKPDDIGREFLLPYSPDPHIIVEPNNYLDRWLGHTNGWLEYKDNILVLNYEDILTNFNIEKEKIENYIGRKIRDSLPDVNDPKLPNFNPGKGIIGEHKNWMDEELINSIDLYIKQNIKNSI